VLAINILAFQSISVITFGYAPARVRNSLKACSRMSWFVVLLVARNVLKRTYSPLSTFRVSATGFSCPDLSPRFLAARRVPEPRLAVLFPISPLVGSRSILASA